MVWRSWIERRGGGGAGGDVAGGAGGIGENWGTGDMEGDVNLGKRGLGV